MATTHLRNDKRNATIFVVSSSVPPRVAINETPTQRRPTALEPSPPPTAVPFKAPIDPQVALEQDWVIASQSHHDGAVAYLMALFRTNPPDLRQRAVAELEK